MGARNRRRWAISATGLGLSALLPIPAHAKAPLGYLHSFGVKTDSITALTWGLLIISIAVIIIITGLVLAGSWKRRARGDAIETVPVERGGDGLSWLYIGVGVSTLVLFGSLIWTVLVLAAVNSPPTNPALTIQVIGHQWWWEARYLSEDPARSFTTANEIHIPAGQPVRVQLIGADVIHSFWVPALTGKTETIPGQINVTWLQAHQPGRYRGQCTEYCGEQHAHMAFFVIAEKPEDFQAWWDAQLKPAPPAASPAILKGQRSFEFHCGACHAVRGTAAGGSVAPDLTHLMSRSTLAAGTLTNTPANLSGWIANPHAIKPGTLMPVLYLSGPELQDIRTYLATLE